MENIKEIKRYFEGLSSLLEGLLRLLGSNLSLHQPKHNLATRRHRNDGKIQITTPEL